MAWNEPGGDKKDPWGNRGNDGGPPDLDEAFRRFKERLSGLFSGRGSGSGSGGGSETGGPGNEKLAWALLGIAILVWLASGFYIVQPPERAVITRFGAFQEVQGPGPHWHLPWPIESSQIVNVASNRAIKLASQTMLTRDENLVRIDLSVQYNVRDAQDFLFQVRAPEETLHQTIESVLREVVGKNDMDFIITEGRGEVAARTQDRTQKIIDGYGTGLNIQAVNLQQAQPPEAVQAAFEDAIKAREDQVRFINEAEAIENRIIPEARGNAEERLEEARAYRNRVLESARGDVARFNALLTEYQNAPAVTRKRLYLDTMEKVMGETGKVLVQRKGEGDNLIYMPLERMLQNAGSRKDRPSGSELPDSVTGAAASEQGAGRGNRPTRSREDNR